MPWLRVEDDYTDHPKTLHLKELLGQDLADVYPVRLWSWVIRYAPGGDLSRYSSATIARACAFLGDPDEFVGNLYAAGFLDVHEDDPVLGRVKKSRLQGERLVVHDWSDYSGQYEEQTRKGRQKAERYRNRLRNGDVTVTSPPEGKEGKEGKEEEGRQRTSRRSSAATALGITPTPLRPSSLQARNTHNPAADDGGNRTASGSTAGFGQFKDWAYQQWLGTGGQGAWSEADWVSLHRGYTLIADPAQARKSWSAYLQDSSSFYQGHYPKKWCAEPARWLRGKPLPPKTAANIAAAQAFISKEKSE